MGIAKSALPTYVDVAIIGAGPVGLAIAIELARLDLTTLVVDRRPPPAEDTGLRPQLLVARWPVERFVSAGRLFFGFDSAL